jgi:hypothetical protein
MSSCATTKYFESNGSIIEAKPYGWMNKQARKNDNVIYQVNGGNVVFSILGLNTVIVPIWLTGRQFYEPVRLKGPVKVQE